MCGRPQPRGAEAADKGWEVMGQTELWNLDTPGASHPLADHPTIFHPNLGTERGLWCWAEMSTRPLETGWEQALG